MASLFDTLKKHNAVIENGLVTMRGRDMATFVDDWARESIIVELQDILDRTNSRSYIRSMLKERINNYKLPPQIEQE